MNTRVTPFDSDLIVEVKYSEDDEPPRFSVDRFMRSLRNFATLSEALRILGAGVILASMSVFLLQGWNDGNDIRRYLLLLTQTGLLAAAGFAMSHLVQETKGARLFFGLALVSIPANFTILGALLYSVFQWDGGLTTYPGYADWRIEDVTNIGITMGAAMLVLVPVAMFCFAIMARHSTKPLSLHFLALNALLLLPIRSSVIAGSVALMGVAYALFVIARLTRENPALKTGEGRFALATLFIPLGIMLFRSMYFYQVDSLMIAMLSMALFLAARQVAQFPGRNAGLAFGLELVSWPLALVIASALTDALSGPLTGGALAAVFSGTYAALGLDIMRRTRSSMLRKVVGGSIAVAVALSFTLTVSLAPTAWNALLCIAAGTLLLLWGAAGRKPLTAVAGLVTAGSGVLIGFDAIMRLVMTSSWIELAIFGAAAIALGSILERHGATMKLRVMHWYRNAQKDKEEIDLDGQPLTGS